MSTPDPLEQALDRVVQDRSPRSQVDRLDEQEQRMVRMAQLLHGMGGQQPDPQFQEELKQRVDRSQGRISRRTAFVSALGTLAAGILATFGLERWSENRRKAPVATRPGVGTTGGTWIQVASLDQLPDGSVRPFSAGAVQGFLLRRNGQVRAMSRICTHLGCALHYSPADVEFICPCHGAKFDLTGTMVPQRSYARELPPLPAIAVRVRDQAVEVREA